VSEVVRNQAHQDRGPYSRMWWDSQKQTKIWQNEKDLICQEVFWEIPEATFINRYFTQLQIRNNKVVCVFQPTWTVYAKRKDPTWMCEQCVCSMCLLPCFEYYHTLRELWMKGSIFQRIGFGDILFSVDYLCVWYFVFYVLTTIPVLLLWKKLFDS
jgi:hypothetical protein